MSQLLKAVSTKKNRQELNLDELILRLKSLLKTCNIEVMKLAIESILDELEGK